MREDWDNLKTILFMLRHGSLAASAAALGVSHTTVARRIAAAEASFGVRLFDRMPTGYTATEAGREAAARAAAMEAEALTLRRRLSGRDQSLAGPFTITAPQLLIAAHLCHVTDAFVGRHPDVELTVLATNELLNLSAHEADLAIRISDIPGDNLIGQRLARQETASFAAPDLARKLREVPDHPVEWLAFTFWKGPPKASLKSHPQGRIKLRFDDMTAVIGAAQAGLGIARMPFFVGRAAGLEQVPVQPPRPYADIWAVSHRDLRNSTKLRAFKDLLLPYFRTHAADFVAAQDQDTSPRNM